MSLTTARNSTGRKKKMVCKGICSNPIYEKKKSVRGAYKLDYKRCTQCDIFIKWDGIFCPCCNNRMKHSPKKSSARQAYREYKKEMAIAI